MSLNDVPLGERIRIGFFGLRNVGKSSLINAIANQDVSVVSDIKGTTTDSVKKSMELQPIGPVTLIDTPGIDDSGVLGEKRIEVTKKILRNCDVAILVTVYGRKLNESEKELLDIFSKRNIPYLIVYNKADILGKDFKVYGDMANTINVSALNKIGVEGLKNKIISIIEAALKNENSISFVSDFVNKDDIILLVTPIDEGAPKGRMILPQQQAIKEVLDSNGIAITVQPEELENTLKIVKPKLVITDSQVFKKVNEIVPKNIYLTSFSVLMARYKGFLDTAVKGAKKIDELDDGNKVLICEGCTHHRQCKDIGTVKLPNLLKKHTKKNLEFEWTSGGDFPENIDKYDLIIHCGGCMLNKSEMTYRMKNAVDKKVPFTNYGTAIAFMNGILERSIEICEMH